MSERHLRRVFLEHVGLTPGHWRRLARFRGAVGLMASPCTLTQVAHGAGYADQAHFCRDFAEIAGMTPGEYRQRVGPLPGHIFSS
jgi:transcriptional regulator GlxA family with amidase domain